MSEQSCAGCRHFEPDEPFGRCLCGDFHSNINSEPGTVFEMEVSKNFGCRFFEPKEPDTPDPEREAHGEPEKER